MTVFWVIAIILAIATYVIFGTMLGSKKTKRLLENGTILNRNRDFYKQVHYFTTDIGDFSAIYAAMDLNTLRTMKISVRPDIPGGRIVFQMRRKVFVAALQQEGRQDESHLYAFGFLRWKESVGLMEGADSANALLSAVERAFVKTDPNAMVEIAPAAFKERFF